MGLVTHAHSLFYFKVCNGSFKMADAFKKKNIVSEEKKSLVSAQGSVSCFKHTWKTDYAMQPCIYFSHEMQTLRVTLRWKQLVMC